MWIKIVNYSPPNLIKCLCSFLFHLCPVCLFCLSVIYPSLPDPFHLEPLTCLPESQFRCEDSSACIDAVARCDSVPDCADSSDERDCGKFGKESAYKLLYDHKVCILFVSKNA